MDLHDVGRFLVKVFNGMRAVGEITSWNDNRVAIRVEECPYDYHRPQICEAHTTMEQALVRGLNPELEYGIEKSIPRGDGFCLHLLKRRGTG